MNDLAHYLQGYVAGYWQGFEFGADPTKDVGEEEDEGGSASGDADAAAESPAPDPRAQRFALSNPGGSEPRGSRASDTLPLPAIGQPALPPEVKVAGELELLFVHRGMVTALAMLVEVFRSHEMYAAASICERAVRGIEIEDERR